MKTKLLSFWALIGCVSAQEAVAVKEPVRQQFGYVELGVGPLPIPLPVFGIGYRSQWNHHGVDVSGQVATVVSATAVQANVLYHYYFKPSLASQFYVGAGVAPSVGFGGRHYGFGISPEFVFGKQYRNESNDLRFFQAQINFPTFVTEARHRYSYWEANRAHLIKYPIVTLSYGIGF